MPPVYVNNGGGVVPFGNPVALNASTAVVGAVDNINPAVQGRINAPFRMSLPQVPPANPMQPLRRCFRTKLYCIVCGWKKKHHTPDEGKGGIDKKGIANCYRQFCGNCFTMKAFHNESPFSPETCAYPTNAASRKNVEEWWEYRVRSKT